MDSSRQPRDILDKSKDVLINLSNWSKTHYEGSIRGAIARKEKEIQLLYQEANGVNMSEVVEKEKELKNY